MILKMIEKKQTTTTTNKQTKKKQKEKKKKKKKKKHRNIQCKYILVYLLLVDQFNKQINKNLLSKKLLKSNKFK